MFNRDLWFDHMVPEIQHPCFNFLVINSRLEDPQNVKFGKRRMVRDCMIGLGSSNRQPDPRIPGNHFRAQGTQLQKIHDNSVSKWKKHVKWHIPCHKSREPPREYLVLRLKRQKARQITNLMLGCPVIWTFPVEDPGFDHVLPMGCPMVSHSHSVRLGLVDDVLAHFGRVLFHRCVMFVDHGHFLSFHLGRAWFMMGCQLIGGKLNRQFGFVFKPSI